MSKVIKNDMGESASPKKREKFVNENHQEITLLKIQKVVQKILSDQKYLRAKFKPELVEWVEDELGVGYDMATRYIRAASKEVRAIGKEKLDKMFQKAIRDREWIINELKELITSETDTNKTQLYGKILDAFKDRDDLSGLYKQTIEHKGQITLKDVNLNSLTTDQLVKFQKLLKSGYKTEEALLAVGVIIEKK